MKCPGPVAIFCVAFWIPDWQQAGVCIVIKEINQEKLTWISLKENTGRDYQCLLQKRKKGTSSWSWKYGTGSTGSVKAGNLVRSILKIISIIPLRTPT